MKGFKSILLVCDHETEDTTSVERAAAFAKRFGARLTVTKVMEELPGDFRALMIDMRPVDLTEVFFEEQRAALKRVIAPIRQEGVKARVDLKVGIPHIEIVQEVIHGEHDLVILAANRKGKLNDWSLDSAYPRLVQDCPCPVWVMRRAMREEPKKILAIIEPDATDKIKNALNAKIMDLASILAQDEGCELHVLGCWIFPGEEDLRKHAGIYEKEIEKVIRQAWQMQELRFESLVKKYRADNPRQYEYFVKGKTMVVASSAAKENKIDLIVMGSICRTGLVGFFAGNLSERVLHQVDCSVLTVKPDTSDVFCFSEKEEEKYVTSRSS